MAENKAAQSYALRKENNMNKINNETEKNFTAEMNDSDENPITGIIVFGTCSADDILRFADSLSEKQTEAEPETDPDEEVRNEDCFTGAYTKRAVYCVPGRQAKEMTLFEALLNVFDSNRHVEVKKISDSNLYIVYDDTKFINFRGEDYMYAPALVFKYVNEGAADMTDDDIKKAKETMEGLTSVLSTGEQHIKAFRL